VDPVPDPLLHRKSGSAGNGTRSSGSVARNSDHWTTEAVIPYTLHSLCQWSLSNLMTDPSSRQRGRYKITNTQMSEENLKEKEKLVKGPRWAPDTKADWPTDCRS
jgi:hypothetical protein